MYCQCSIMCTVEAGPASVSCKSGDYELTYHSDLEDPMLPARTCCEGQCDCNTEITKKATMQSEQRQWAREQHSKVDLARRVPMDRLVSETAQARH